MRGSGLSRAPDGPGGGSMMEGDMRLACEKCSPEAGAGADEGDDPEYLMPSNDE